MNDLFRNAGHNHISNRMVSPLYPIGCIMGVYSEVIFVAWAFQGQLGLGRAWSPEQSHPI